MILEQWNWEISTAKGCEHFAPGCWRHARISWQRNVWLDLGLDDPQKKYLDKSVMN
jgi:hypothetical protein